MKFQQSKSPLGITKAWSFGPGFFTFIGISLFNIGFFIQNSMLDVHFFSASGMIPFMQLPEMFPCNVGINLGGGNIYMAEHNLNRSQVGAAL